MRPLIIWVLLAASPGVFAGPVTLSLPQGAILTFDGPKMTQLKEVNAEDRYQYVASSIGEPDRRYSLSVYVEPLDCARGKTLSKLADCFVEQTKQIPNVVMESDSPSCDRNRCVVMYVTRIESGGKTIPQLHANTLFIHGGSWVDVHLSAVNPTQDDPAAFGRFLASLKLK